jgi:hypothetical protein
MNEYFLHAIIHDFLESYGNIDDDFTAHCHQSCEPFIIVLHNFPNLSRLKIQSDALNAT